MLGSFRYEQCYKTLDGPSKPQQPDDDFRDLLLGQIGLIYRRGQSRNLMTLCIHLGKHVDDPRRHRNEDTVQQEPNLNYESESGTPSEPPLKSLHSLYEILILIVV